MRAGAAFLLGHPECFHGGARADNPAHVALSAVVAQEVFLAAPVSERGTVAAVVVALERFREPALAGPPRE